MQSAASALRAVGFSVRTVLGETAPDALTRAREAAEGITGYADGEPLGPVPLTAECVRGAVRVAEP